MKSLVIPFGPGTQRKRLIGHSETPPGEFPYSFYVRNVIRTRITDRARIDVYDIVDAKYDDDRQVLTIKSSFPFVMEVEVTEPFFEVET